MQIYYTNRDPAKCAANLPCTLRNKTLVEVAQLMCSFLEEHGVATPYQRIAQGIAFKKWIGESWFNWQWLGKYAYWLNQEYMKDRRKDDFHKSYEVILEIFSKPTLEMFTGYQRFTDPPIILKADTPAYVVRYCFDLSTERAYQFYLNYKVNQFKKDGKPKGLYTWPNGKPDFITV